MGKILSAIILISLFVAVPAWAETLEGTVESLDFGGSSMTVEVTKEGAEPQMIEVGVTEGTKYSGEVSVFAEVLEGDEVILEGAKDAATGKWIAASVEVPPFEGEFDLEGFEFEEEEGETEEEET